jgi:ATP-dependent 26S proteasome regulatory subunit
MFAIRKEKEQVEVEDMESAISKVLFTKNSSNTVSDGMFA